MPPKVSVNICCYNSEKFIKETIESALSQTFGDLEAIIIDDGSKDRTAEIVRSIADPRIKYYFQENQGLSNARNKALELSNGEYIALLDHDDVWEKNKLELQVPLLESDVSLGLVYCDIRYFSEKDGLLDTYFEHNAPRRGRVTKYLIERNFIPCLSVVMRKSFMEKAGRFRNNMGLAEEYEYFLRLSMVCGFDYIDKVLGKCRIHENNASRDEIGMHKEEILALNLLREEIKDKELGKIIVKGLAHYRTNLAYSYLSRGDKAAARRELTDVIWRFPSTRSLIAFALLYFPQSIYKLLQDLKQLCKKALKKYSYGR